MKCSRSDIRRKIHALPKLRFEDQPLTSFSGLVIFQRLIEHLKFKEQLGRCFGHLNVTPIFGHSRIVLLLMTHLLLGYRPLRHMRYYQEDPLILRLLGVTRLPDVATVSRTLSAMDSRSVDNLQQLLCDGVLNRLKSLALRRVTLDFDGSVIGTGRFAEGAAIGFNPRKKGRRSYYPLFCTVAQTGQVLAVLHRSGNVHDSNGAKAFILGCIDRIRARLPGIAIEVRMDSAFFSDAMVGALDQEGIEYTISVPFERFTRLKSLVEQRQYWYRLDDQCEYFESHWKPQSWSRRHRFLFVQKLSKIQYKQPIQLDLFTPYEYGYEYKVIVTNKRLRAAGVVAYHNGRGSQEKIFAELKSQCQLDYVPTRTWRGNQVYLLSALLAHNLTRELQILVREPSRTTQPKRPALWDFEQLLSFRQRIVQRAGRLIRPQGKLTLSMNANQAIQNEMLHYLNTLDKVA